MGGLEPSSNQAGSGEQFKRREKYISPGGLMFQKQMFVEPYKTMIPVLTAQSVSRENFLGFFEQRALLRTGTIRLGLIP
jgi:hypothetical protein